MVTQALNNRLHTNMPNKNKPKLCLLLWLAGRVIMGECCELKYIHLIFLYLHFVLTFFIVFNFCFVINPYKLIF